MTPTASNSHIEQRQEPPGRTPDIPPPKVTPETESAPPTTPASETQSVSPTDATADNRKVELEAEPERVTSESLYGEDLPPDFWGSDPVAEVDIGAVAQDEPRPDEVDFGVSSRPSQTSQPRPQPRQEVEGKLEDDPRFAVMQSLFPGQIVEWQESEVTEEERADEASADDPDEDAAGLN